VHEGAVGGVGVALGLDVVVDDNGDDEAEIPRIPAITTGTIPRMILSGWEAPRWATPTPDLAAP